MNATIKYIADRLATIYDSDEATAIAYWLVEEKCAMTRTQLIMQREPVQIDELDSLIERLLAHEPIQYILGYTDWNGLRLRVTQDTLIPRPETAELLQLLPDAHGLRVLDIGTGTGCLAIATKLAHPDWQVSALDISHDALDIAQENARQNGADVQFLHHDILADEPLREQYDIVISNPPYIMLSEKDAMRDNVLRYEPHTALFVPDNDPLLFYRRIAELHLAPILLLEINEALAEQTANLMHEYGYTHTQIHKDNYGKERFVTARIPS